MAENVVVQNADGEAAVYENVSGVELVTESGGTATFIHNAEIKQADWTQTDSTQKDYIKNKPDLAPAATEGTYASLKEKPFYDIPTVLEETELSFELDEEFQIYVAGAANTPEMIPGETYKVVWDGEEYLCICHGGQIFEGLGDENTRHLGNKTLVWNLGWGEDTGEPFSVGANASEPGLYIETLDTDAVHTVSITPVNEAKKLDKKYLPDGISGGISAVEVTLMLASAGVIEPAADENNFVLTDEKNDIYIY